MTSQRTPNTHSVDLRAPSFSTPRRITRSWSTTGGTVYGIVRSALNGGELDFGEVFNTGTTQGAEGQSCISADGQTVYTASGYPYNFYGTSLATKLGTQALPAEAYPNSVSCVWNGLIVGGTDAYYNATDVYVYYGPTGVQLALLDSSSLTNDRALTARGLAISADGTRMVTIVSVAADAAVKARFDSFAHQNQRSATQRVARRRKSSGRRRNGSIRESPGELLDQWLMVCQAASAASFWSRPHGFVASLPTAVMSRADGGMMRQGS